MKYSVLMTVYAKENPEYLKLALESVYDDQTRKPDEIVVIFDGELTDDLYNVLDDFKKGKENTVFYYPQTENRGTGEASRIGVEKCTGDYIFRMDSDDISLPDRFEKQILYIESHPEIDVLGGSIVEFFDSIDEENKRRRICPQSHNDIVYMGKKRNPMNHVSVCMKASSLKLCGNYKTLLLLEDYYLWLRMIAKGCRFENLKEDLVYVRVGNGFDKKRGSKLRITGWKVLQKFMLENNMINKLDAFLNMFYIRVFVYCPSIVKRIAYKKFLRK